MTYTRKSSSLRRRLSLFTLALLTTAVAASHEHLFKSPSELLPRIVSPRTEKNIPIRITNNCAEDIWPALASQAGTGPDSNGFLLKPGTNLTLYVGSDWQGRIWGRTNCSFNADGSGPSNLNGNNGGGQACGTGDCNGVLNCVVTGLTPVTLAEFLLSGGANGKQDFYDLSLVDGYNLPMSIKLLAGNSSALLLIPPNLTNCICIATAGLLSDVSTTTNSTNSTYPIPYNTRTTNSDLSNWCPWNLQLNPPTKPGDGVYPYPDDNIQRPGFDPCLSACAKTNAPSDCCTGSYNDPNVCKPGLYSTQAKTVCPDAYSFAFDDQTSTFVIPSGGGFEITFCPNGASTNILKTFAKQLAELASTGTITQQVLTDAQNTTIIQEGGAVMGGGRERVASLGALVVVLAWACLW